jgi:hypothetical protein
MKPRKSSRPRKAQKATSKSKRDALPQAEFKDPDKPKSAKITGSSSSLELAANMKLFYDLPRELIIATPKILEDHLQNHVKLTAQKRAWTRRLPLTLMLLLALVTSDFKDWFLLSGPVWHAVFLVVFAASIVWLAQSVITGLKAAMHRTSILTDIKNESIETSQSGLWVLHEPEGEKDQS